MNFADNIQNLWKEAKNYLELQKEYLKLDTAEKLSVLLSAVATVAVCLTFALSALFFLVLAFAFWLADFVGGAWSFAIVSGVMLLFIILTLLVRKRWIMQPITRFVVSLFVDENEEEEEVS
jgi:O-antigen ligase